MADTIGLALQFVPREHLIACTNCGLAPMNRDVALRKLQALAEGAALARQRQAGLRLTMHETLIDRRAWLLALGLPALGPHGPERRVRAPASMRWSEAGRAPTATTTS